MRLFPRTDRTRTVGLTLASAALVLVCAGTTSLLAGADDDEDDEADSAEARKMAMEQLDKAVARGRELWNSKDLGRKTCGSCHDSAEKPALNLATREWSFPAYSRRKRGVVTLHQKIQEMIQFNTRGQPLDDKGPDVAALAAYAMSLKKK